MITSKNFKKEKRGTGKKGPEFGRTMRAKRRKTSGRRVKTFGEGGIKEKT